MDFDTFMGKFQNFCGKAMDHMESSARTTARNMDDRIRRLERKPDRTPEEDRQLEMMRAKREEIRDQLGF